MTIVLGIALAAVLLLLIVRRRHLGVLLQLATLLGGVLLLIWLQDSGYLGSPRAVVEQRSAPASPSP